MSVFLVWFLFFCRLFAADIIPFAMAAEVFHKKRNIFGKSQIDASHQVHQEQEVRREIGSSCRLMRKKSVTVDPETTFCCPP